MKSRWIGKIFPFGGLPQAVYALIAAFFAKEPAADQVERGGRRENVTAALVLPDIKDAVYTGNAGKVS